MNRCIESTAGGQASTFVGNPNYLETGLAENARKDLYAQSHNPTLKKERQRLMFLPNAFFMGAKKNDPIILEMMEYVKIRDPRVHFSVECAALGGLQQWCLTKVLDGKMYLVDGEIIGTKKAGDKTPVLIEDLLEEGFLDVRPDSFGVYIPEDEILKRNKYQWFSVMSGEEILQSRLAIGKCLVESIVNYLPTADYTAVDSLKNTDDVKMKEKTVFSI
jgi:hypothetical protein